MSKSLDLGSQESSGVGSEFNARSTGKTVTALKLTERIATEAGRGSARVPFLVPSISRLSQGSWLDSNQRMKARALWMPCSRTSSEKFSSERARDSCSVPTMSVNSPSALSRADCGFFGAR